MEFKRAFAAGTRRHRAFLAVVPIAALLRLTGIGYGLPAVFNGDEPHHVNVAISFGRGSLNPGIFKYPTLWMYVLFAVYAAGFVLWSGAGLLRSVQGFGELFVWHPEGFYLAGRLLAAAFSLGGLWWVYRAGSLAGGRASGALAAALLAVSAPLVESAHSVKPDCLMFFFAAWSWRQAMAYLSLGGARRLLFCAAAVGLSVSSQYTAAPLAVLVPVVWLARRSFRPGRADRAGVLAAALAVVGLVFLAGTPFALLDAPAFARDMRDSWAVHGAGQAVSAGWRPFFNLMGFSAPWPLGAVALAAGAVWLWRRRPTQFICLLLPCLAAALFFSRQAVGGNPRYLYSVFPAVAILAALGVRAVFGRLKWAAWLLLLLPGAWSSWSADRELLLPDTRNVASAWIQENLPPGTRILSDYEADSPRVAMSLEFAQRNHERTKASGHPRRRYYQLMATGHPGGGYEVYQVQREAAELLSGPWHARWSASGRPVMDVHEGLGSARKADVEVVILTSYGLARNESEPYVRQARSQGRLLAEFRPEPGKIRGPRIEIHRIGTAR